MITINLTESQLAIVRQVLEEGVRARYQATGHMEHASVREVDEVIGVINRQTQPGWDGNGSPVL